MFCRTSTYLSYQRNMSLELGDGLVGGKLGQEYAVRDGAARLRRDPVR